MNCYMQRWLKCMRWETVRNAIKIRNMEWFLFYYTFVRESSFSECSNAIAKFALFEVCITYVWGRQMNILFVQHYFECSLLAMCFRYLFLALIFREPIVLKTLHYIFWNTRATIVMFTGYWQFYHLPAPVSS